MIEGSQIQLQNVNTLNPDSILSQPAASQPESKRQMVWTANAGQTICLAIARCPTKLLAIAGDRHMHAGCGSGIVAAGGIRPLKKT
jgi:hypothetical protein